MGPVIEGACLGGQSCPKGVTIRRADFHQGPLASGYRWRPAKFVATKAQTRCYPKASI